MAYAPQLDFKQFVERKKHEHVGGAPETAGHDYTYIADKQTREAFDKIRPVRIAMEAAVRVFNQVGKSQILGSGVKVSARQFPRIHKLVERSSDALQIAAPAIYIVNNPVMNAYAFGTSDESFIVLHSGLIDYFDDEELLSVIGHESGHIHNQHAVYLTTLNYLTRMAGTILWWVVEPALVALRAWSRRAEITCDRASLLCTGDEGPPRRALAKLALGSQKLSDQLDIDAFLEQYEEGKLGYGRFTEAMGSHPYLPKRILAMRVFAESALYRKSIGLGDTGLTMPEVDDRVRALLKGDA
jgi:Zn-dependent protease with chaperone function